MKLEAPALLLAVLAAGCTSGERSSRKDDEELFSSPLLDELIERSRDIKSFRARFQWREEPDEDATNSVQVEYRAPDALRYDLSTLGDGDTSLWFVGHLMVTRVSDESRKYQFRADFKELGAAASRVSTALDREFPRSRSEPPTLPGGPNVIFEIDWASDPEAEEESLSVCAVFSQGTATPLGWLRTLQRKRAEPTESPEQLRFVTDEGRATVAISRSTGFLEELVVRGSEKTLILKLESLELDTAIEPERLELPRVAFDGEDLSDSFADECRRTSESHLREKIYGRILGTGTGGTWDAAFRSRVESVLRPLPEVRLLRNLEPRRLEFSAWILEIAEEVRDLREEGEPQDEIEEEVAEAREELTELLDEEAESLSETLELPEGEDSDRAEDLLAIERAVVTAAFHEQFGKSVVEEFERAMSAGAE